MPYIVIKGLPVFLHADLWHMVHQKALAEKTPEFRIGSTIQGTPEAREADRMMCQFLIDQFEIDAASFAASYVEFDLTGNSAQENVWDAVYDFCCLYGCGWTSDTRDTTSAVIDSYMGNTFTYPQGRTFLFVVAPRSRGWLARILSRWPKPLASIVIECDKVSRIAGTLSHFKLLMGDMEIDCDCGRIIVTPQRG